GRQGDPGLSQFFVSMDDDVMRIFGSDRMKGFMNRMGVPDDMPIENRMVSHSIEAAQKKVESHNFDIRKHLVEYDDVMNKHRDVVYKKRNEILDMNPEQLHEYIQNIVNAEIELIVSFHSNPEEGKEWDIAEMCTVINTIFPSEGDCIKTIEQLRGTGESKLEDAEARTKIIEFFTAQAKRAYTEMKEVIANEQVFYQATKGLSLRAIDTLWIEHLDQMSFLRDSIGLRGYAQRDPLVEYKHESYQLFQSLLANIQKQVVYSIFKLRDAKLMNQKQEKILQERHEYHAPAKEMQKQQDAQKQPFIATGKKDSEGHKIGRNDPCPCGSGKKYKKCHGDSK
ncbi:MAG TPA: SEC-C metal-binding domain-containing protein, partial [Patescibacteria group bacterium]|nr:SEC-C metal-binding domain-containing protein [Patescibacteria group bacterium]